MKIGSLVYRNDDFSQYGEVMWSDQSNSVVYWASGKVTSCYKRDLIMETDKEKIKAAKNSRSFKLD